jgi:hypothetical protein
VNGGADLLLEELGGWPFLDDGFDTRRLMTICAAVRYAEARRRGLATGETDGHQAAAWLGPARAYMLSTAATPMPAQPLSHGQRQQITGASAEVASLLPAWQPLMSLPVRYALLVPDGGAISASSRDWPQHVLLAGAAFATSRELTEQLLHELAHQWLYLIEDIWPLEHPGAARRTLPSGTPHRRPAEVLGAAHVAAVLTRFYHARPSAWSASRITSLREYGTRCLDLVAAAGADLTDAGALLARQLKEAL